MTRVSLLVALALVLPVAAVAAERGLLWRVVQACVATHQLIGTPFPCLAVDTRDGTQRGYAVVRAPFETTHIVVTPTARVPGIEATTLQAADAPAYLADAWSARHFVTDGMAHLPDRTDLALAVNSRPGRSQDQLHIHVDCIQPRIKRALLDNARGIKPGSWTRVAVLPHGPRYSATVLDDLAGANIFRLVQDGLQVAQNEMDEVTIVVVGASVEGRPGFIVLARRRAGSRDEAHGEALMDHGCRAFLADAR